VLCPFCLLLSGFTVIGVALRFTVSFVKTPVFNSDTGFTYQASSVPVFSVSGWFVAMFSYYVFCTYAVMVLSEITANIGILSFGAH